MKILLSVYVAHSSTYLPKILDEILELGLGFPPRSPTWGKGLGDRYIHTTCEAMGMQAVASRCLANY